MKQIVTRSGFEVEVEEDRADDWELFNMACEIDNGDLRPLKRALTLLLGDEGLSRLTEHIRAKTGRVKLTDVAIEYYEIFGGISKK